MKLANILRTSALSLMAVGAISCTSQKSQEVEKTWSEKAIENARKQIGLEIDTIEASGKILNPVTLTPEGKVFYCGYEDWRSGFFPGNVWYLYELTNDSTLIPLAQKYTEALDSAKTLTWHHDIGFIVNCSYGNGLRLSHKEAYKDVMIEAAGYFGQKSNRELCEFLVNVIPRMDVEPANQLIEALASILVGNKFDDSFHYCS